MNKLLEKNIFLDIYKNFDWNNYATNHNLNHDQDIVNHYLNLTDTNVVTICNEKQSNNFINKLSTNSFKNNNIVKFTQSTDVISQLKILRETGGIFINNNLILSTTIPDENMIITYHGKIIYMKLSNVDYIDYIIHKLENSSMSINDFTLTDTNNYISIVDNTNANIFFNSHNKLSFKNFVYIENLDEYSINYPIVDTPFFNLTKNNINKNIKILLTSTQYYSYGGAATNIYNIHLYLKQLGYNVCSIFFNYGTDVNYNPLGLDNVYIEERKLIENNFEKIKNKIITNFGYPDLILAKNYVAPQLCKNIFSDSIIVYLVSGIPHFLFKQYEKLTFNDFINLPTIIEHPQELKAVESSNFILVNSTLTYEITKKIYGPNKLYKSPVNTTEIITTGITMNNNYEKKYDIVICVSNLTRVCKNIEFLDSIMIKLKHYTKCVIGESYEKYNHWENTTFTGLISNEKVIDIIKTCKLMILPTLFESNSNSIMEALHNGCLVLVSNNLGNYDKLPNEFVLYNFNNDDWTNRIIHLIENYDKYNNFKNNFSYDNGLLDVIEEFIYTNK